MNHLGELNEIVTRWIAAHPLAEVVDRLSAAGVSVAPIYTNRQILDDPHFRARGSIVRAKDEDFGSVAVPGVVPRLSATPGEVRTSGPCAGRAQCRGLRRLARALRNRAAGTARCGRDIESARAFRREVPCSAG
jgi:crotonobetainyl-CoA:carnitine CoA-transferase CaiB-like acyl-CoA transferase